MRPRGLVLLTILEMVIGIHLLLAAFSYLFLFLFAPGFLLLSVLMMSVIFLVLSSFSLFSAYRVWNCKSWNSALILAMLLSIMWVISPFEFYLNVWGNILCSIVGLPVVGFLLNLVAIFLLTRPYIKALFGKVALPTELTGKPEKLKAVVPMVTEATKEAQKELIPVLTGPKAKMEIKVLVKDEKKFVRLEVEPHHTVGSLVVTLVEGLKLPENVMYTLKSGGREFSEDEFSTTLVSGGINAGDQLELVSKPKEVLHEFKYCLSCGEKLPSDAKYCSRCSEKQESET